MEGRGFEPRQPRHLLSGRWHNRENNLTPQKISSKRSEDGLNFGFSITSLNTQRTSRKGSVMFKKSFPLLFVVFITFALDSKQPKTTIPSSAKHAIIFDCDGTLVSNEEELTRAWQDALKLCNLHLTCEEVTPCMGLDFPTAKDYLSKKYNVAIPHSIVDNVTKAFSKFNVNHIKPIIPCVELVKHLAANKDQYNIVLAVASGSNKHLILKNLKIAGIENCFDAIVSGQDDVQEYKTPHGTNKPQPCVYLQAAHLLGVPSWNCIAFEDSRTGAEAALQAGMHVFAVPTNGTKSQFTHAHYCHRITFLKSAQEFDINRYLTSQIKIRHHKAQEHKAVQQ